MIQFYSISKFQCNFYIIVSSIINLTYEQNYYNFQFLLSTFHYNPQIYGDCMINFGQWFLINCFKVYNVTKISAFI